MTVPAGLVETLGTDTEELAATIVTEDSSGRAVGTVTEDSAGGAATENADAGGTTTDLDMEGAATEELRAGGTTSDEEEAVTLTGLMSCGGSVGTDALPPNGGTKVDPATVACSLEVDGALMELRLLKACGVKGDMDPEPSFGAKGVVDPRAAVLGANGVMDPLALA